MKKQSPDRRPFSVAALRRLLRPILKGASYGQTMPNSAALAQLADVLNAIREFHFVEADIAPGNAHRQAIKAALSRAAEEIDKLKAERKQCLDVAERCVGLNPDATYYSASVAAVRDQLAEIEQTAALLRYVETLGALQERGNGVLSWTDHGDHIVAAFARAMRSTNPNFKGGAGHDGDGPTVRFLAAVMPALTGERYKLNTISAHLKRRCRSNAYDPPPGYFRNRKNTPM